LRITIYSTPDCQASQATKRLVSERGLDYREIDIEQDREAAKLLQAAGHKTFPVVVINGRNSSKTWTGFRLDQILLLPWRNKNGTMRYIEKSRDRKK
jgi:glutaredoxin-like protein NrdH